MHFPPLHFDLNICLRAVLYVSVFVADSVSLMSLSVPACTRMLVMRITLSETQVPTILLCGYGDKESSDRTV